MCPKYDARVVANAIHSGLAVLARQRYGVVVVILFYRLLCSRSGGFSTLDAGTFPAVKAER